MAIRTQIRLPQITGSFGSSGINDQISSAATGSINAGDLQTVLSHMAGAIKRIHGADSFSEQVAGGFSQGIIVQSGDGIYIGAGADEFSITEASDDITMNVEQTDKDLIFKATPGGVSTEIARIDGSASSLLMASSKKIEFGDADTYINQASDGVLQLRSDSVVKAVIGSTDALTINSTGATFGQNLTVTGDLTVNGSQTVLDTTSLVIEDSVIALASGSAANADVNSALVFQRASANLGNDADMQNGALMFLQGTGFKLGYTNDNAETAQGSLAIADDDLGDVYVGKLLIDGSSNTLDVASSDLTAVAGSNFVVDAASNIVLDADGGTLQFKDGGTLIGEIINSSGLGALTISGSAGKSLILDAGQTIFAKQGGSIGTSATLETTTANQIRFGYADLSGEINWDVPGNLTLKTNAITVLSASSGLQIDAGADSAQLRLLSNGGGYVSVAAPDSLIGAGNWTLTLPSDNGNANQVLKTDGNGITSWVNQAEASYGKAIKEITTPVDAGTGLSMSSVNHGSTVEFNLPTEFAKLDVFVNGALMISGSESDRSAGNVDYRISGDKELKFSFRLEADDVVAVTSRS